MTLQQEKLVTDNHHLIYYTLRKLGCDIDEFYDICAIGLCKAALNYDSNKGIAFSTYAVTYMKGLIWREWTRLNKQKIAIRTISLTSPIGDMDDFTLQDIIESQDKSIDAVDLKLALERITSLTDKEKQIVSMCIAGYKQREIAAHLGVSYARIGQIVQTAREKIRRVLKV